MSSVARSLTGPLAVAIAVWCAAGELTVATAGSTVRLAVPAPWWVFVTGLAAGLTSPSWRRSPWLAAPALFAALPWLPIPLPAIALVWTGPMAWAPIAVATAIGPGRAVAAAAVRALTALPPARATLAAGALSLIVGLAAAWSLAPRLPGGDEPHYLVITQSLLRDGDLRIENNHASRDYAEYFGGTINPDYLVRGQDNEIYSIHAPGVSALVAPAFAAFGYRGAQAMVLLLAALASGLIWRAGFELTADAGAAWFGWAAVTLSITFVIQSVTIFPDGPGALGVVAGCLLLVRLTSTGPAPGHAALVAIGTLLAGLPWLHTRFVVLAAGLGVAIAWGLWRAGSDTRERLRRVAAFVAIPAASAVLWFGSFWAIYGTPNPTAPYGASPETSWTFVPGGLLGLLFDQQFGLFVAAPGLLAAVVGVAGRGGVARRWAFGIAAVYFAVVCTYWMWWAGRPASPARFTAAALPALALPAAWAWHRAAGVGRAIWLAALALSAATTTVLVFVRRGALAWNDRTADALLLEWLGPVVDLPRGLPSFFDVLDPGRLASEWAFVGHVAATAGVLTVVVMAARSSASRAGSLAAARAAIALWALAGLMAVVQTGWWVTGTAPLDPARGQFQVLGVAGERSLWQVAGGLPVRVEAGRAGMRIVPGRPGRTTLADAPAAFPEVPPMRARLRLSEDQPATGTATVRIGRSPGPWRRFDAGPSGDNAFDLILPAGAATLLVELDASLRAAGVTPSLEPLAAWPATPHRASSVAAFDGAEAHFLDANVFVESSGFWVRGGSTAAVVWSIPGAAASGFDLLLRNGGTPNDVRVRRGRDAEWQQLPLEPSEEVVLTLAVVEGVAVLEVESPAGFRPSEVGGGEDRRYLGVWIAPR